METVEVELWFKDGTNVISKMTTDDAHKLVMDFECNTDREVFKCRDEDGDLLFLVNELIMLSVHDIVNDSPKKRDSNDYMIIL